VQLLFGGVQIEVSNKNIDHLIPEVLHAENVGQELPPDAVGKLKGDLSLEIAFWHESRA
jgi:hypothetical protein